MKQKLINAEALSDEMYRKSFLVDDGRNKWDSGLWIRYKIFEEAIKDAPTVEAIPIEWIYGFWREHMTYGVVRLMMDEWNSGWMPNKEENDGSVCENK